MNERNGFALAFCCVLVIQAGDAGFSASQLRLLRVLMFEDADTL